MELYFSFQRTGRESEGRRQAADRRVEVGNAGKKQESEGMSIGDRCCVIISSEPDGNFKSHKDNRVAIILSFIHYIGC